MQNRYLVTAATGKIGSEFVNLLASQHQFVRAAMRDTRRSPFRQPEVEAWQFDHFDHHNVHDAFENINKLFLIVPGMNVASEMHFAKIVLDQAMVSDVDQIVLISGMGAEKHEISSHIQNEQYLFECDCTVTSLRPNFFMQNFNTFFVDSIKNQQAIRIYSDAGKYSYIDVRDIAAAAATIFASEGHDQKIYPLTGKESLNHADVAKILSKVIGKSIVASAKSDEDTKTYLTELGWPSEDIILMTSLLHRVAAGEYSQVTNDLQNILQRDPISFEQYAADYREAWL